jgi:LuxR family maltose regulon positive regulatory protein
MPRMQPRKTAEDAATRPSWLNSIRLRPPESRSIDVRRPQLTNRLIEARSKIALFVAPPGFGKTSLLADWANNDPRPFAWISVAREDSDPAVLGSYMAAALAKARNEDLSPDRLTALARDADPLSTLGRELESIEGEIVIVLDDYFLIEGRSTGDSILRFIERAPPSVEFAIASRVEPPFPIARMRANGQVLDIGTPDLRFTLEESETFLNGSLSLGLDTRQVRILYEKTEGWPAGLYLAYLSLRTATEPDVFVQRFGASDRHVGDYLTEQVLVAQESETLEFMLATSVVDRVSAPLADALTDAGDSARRLRELERANVFLSSLDDRGWYRYHHILRELLLLELRRGAPETEADLHVRASAWYESVGDADRAIGHALDARDTQRAARLISANYVLRLEWGQTATIAGWLDRVGDEAVRADARLGIVKAWTMHFLGRHAEGRRALLAARRTAFEGELPDGASSIESSAALMAAAFPGGDIGAMVTAARRAFELESDRDRWRVTVHVLLGFALVREGSFAEAEPYLATGEEFALQAKMWLDAVGAKSLRAKIAMEQGDLPAAIEGARSAVQLAEKTGIVFASSGGFARAILGAILVGADQPEEGSAILEEAIGALRALDEPIPLAEALLALAQGRSLLGDRRGAGRALAEADGLIAAMPDPGVLRVTRRSVATAVSRRSKASRTPLSAREIEVLRLLAAGLSKRETATRLFISYNTVHSHVRTIYRKLGVGSRSEAVALGRRNGLVG